MKYLSSVLLTTASLVAGAFLAGSASAAGISFISTPGTDPFLGLDAFDDGTAPGYTFAADSSLVTPNIVSGSVTNQYATPFGDTSKYLAVQPEGSGTVGTTVRGAILYTSPTLLSTFSMYWGSADPSNQLDFYNGTTFIQTITGSNVFGAGATGSWTDPAANQYVTFTADSRSKFDKIKFSTGQIAFEFDAKPVPVPAIVPGIALAAAFFGSKAIKRNKKDASESVA